MSEDAAAADALARGNWVRYGQEPGLIFVCGLCGAAYYEGARIEPGSCCARSAGLLEAAVGRGLPTLRRPIEDRPEHVRT